MWKQCDNKCIRCISRLNVWKEEDEEQQTLFMWVPKAALPQEGETSPCFENAFCFLSFREWVRGFYDLLRKKPSSQFMPLGCSSISITSLRASPHAWIFLPGCWSWWAGCHSQGQCCVLQNTTLTFTTWTRLYTLHLPFPNCYSPKGNLIDMISHYFNISHQLWGSLQTLNSQWLCTRSSRSITLIGQNPCNLPR